MKQAMIGFYVIILIGTISFCAVASDTNLGTNSSEDSIIVGEDIIIVFADEPQHHYMNAFENFLKRDWEGASFEIRKGAAFIKMEAARATADAKKRLMASAQMLEKLAGDIKKGVVRSAKDLQDVFAKAEYTVAKHHHLKAAEAWGEKRIKKTGQELNAALISLENGFTWAGKKLEAGMLKIVDDARHIAGRLIDDEGWAADRVGKALEYMGIEIDKLGKTLAGK
jgi:hypothetical protein